MKILETDDPFYHERFIFNTAPGSPAPSELSFAAYLDSEFKVGFRYFIKPPSPYFVLSLVLKGELLTVRKGKQENISRKGQFSFGTAAGHIAGIRTVAGKDSYIRKCILLHKTDFAGSLLRTFFPGGSCSILLEKPERAERIFDLFKAHFENASPQVDPCYLTGLLAELLELARSQKAEKRFPASFENALLYIDKHFSEPGLSREEVSYAAGVSVRTLSRLFLQYTGNSMLEYITTKRLQRVIELLSLPLLRNKEIAASSGFSSVIYMDRVFRKRFGMTPSQYRKSPPGI